MIKTPERFTPAASAGVNPHLRPEIGRRLAQVRGSANQAEFSALLGIHKNTYGGYERGEREIGADALASLVEQGWNTNWLLTGEGPQRLDTKHPMTGTETNSRVEESEPSHTLSAERLSISIELVDKILGDRWLPTSSYARLTGLMYEALQEGVAFEEILRSGQAIASRIFGGSDVDSEPAVENTRRSGIDAGRATHGVDGRQRKNRKAG